MWLPAISIHKVISLHGVVDCLLHFKTDSSKLILLSPHIAQFLGNSWEEDESCRKEAKGKSRKNGETIVLQ